MSLGDLKLPDRGEVGGGWGKGLAGNPWSAYPVGLSFWNQIVSTPLSDPFDCGACVWLQK